MYKILVLAVAILAGAGCGPSFRQITLTVDPPDARIEVFGEAYKPGTTYNSPASIPIPLDKTLAAQSRIVITHKDYKKTELPVSTVQGDSVRIKLEKVIRYRPIYSLVFPVNSAVLGFRDKIISVTIAPRETNFDLNIFNLAQKPVAVYWDTAEYTDVRHQPHRVFPSTVRLEDRGGEISPQTIPVNGSLQVSVTPMDSVSYAGAKGYVVKPLFVLDNDSALDLIGKTIKLSFSVAVGGAIIIPSYTLKIKIDDVVAE